MGYNVSYEKMDAIIGQLQENYKVFAPKRLVNRGWKPNTDLIRYGEINSASEIVYDVKSDFSPKEVFFPISQTMLYFTEGACDQSILEDSRDIILFARPCDINGFKRLDKIFLENGGNADYFYKRLREKVKIFMIECREGWDTCFCASMATNKTDDYDVAFRFDQAGMLVNVKEESFDKYFAGGSQKDFEPEFVEENKTKVKLPKIDSKELLHQVYKLDFWDSYNDRCISCGGCNTVCNTCSCFDTTDITYNETSRDGERRRVWSSCMLENYSAMAGGHIARKTAGERMRFKTLHKVYDYKARFDESAHMCVGCGRCVSRCPEDISFSDTINTLTTEIEKLVEGSDTL